MQRRIDAAFDFIDRVLERPERYPDEAVPFLKRGASLCGIH